MSRDYPFHDRWTLNAPLDIVWTLVTRVDQYTSWWPGLHRCDLTRLAVGATGTCGVRSPLGFGLHFDMHIADVRERELITADVTGDLEGHGALRLFDGGPTTDVELTFEVDLRQRVLSPLSPIGRPAFRWAHNVLVARWVRSFRQVLREAVA